MRILVLNCGSSSIKFQLIETEGEAIKSNSDRCVAKGSVERIGGEASTLNLTVPPDKILSQTEEILDHSAALTKVIAALKRAEAIADVSQIQAVGHRVVHGGERFGSSMVIDCHIEAGYCHTGGLPMSVHMFCLSSRRACARISAQGKGTFRTDPMWFTDYMRRETVEWGRQTAEAAE